MALKSPTPESKPPTPECTKVCMMEDDGTIYHSLACQHHDEKTCPTCNPPKKGEKLMDSRMLQKRKDLHDAIYKLIDVRMQTNADGGESDVREFLTHAIEHLTDQSLTIGNAFMAEYRETS